MLLTNSLLIVIVILLYILIRKIKAIFDFMVNDSFVINEQIPIKVKGIILGIRQDIEKIECTTSLINHRIEEIIKKEKIEK